jgi:hypothetical protein
MQTTTRVSAPPPISHERRNQAITAMTVGLLLTIVATVVPFVTPALRDHLRAAYPGYTEARIDRAVTTWLVVLTVVGVLGAAGWVGSIWMVATRTRGATVVATSLFLLGTAVALSGLLVEDTSGDPGLAPVLGWIGMLPCVAGAVAVAQLWRPHAR